MPGEIQPKINDPNGLLNVPRNVSRNKTFAGVGIMAKRRRDVEVPEANGEHLITIENFGPIVFQQFRFIPGKITVAFGSNGAGKSESQIAADALVIGSKDALEKVTLREGAERGRISGFGRELTFTAKRCEKGTGQVSVCVVEQGFSLARFVRPGFKDPEANDRQRLKDLASLLEIKPDPKSVYQLVGGLDDERAKLEDLPEAERPAALAKIEARERAIYNAIVTDKTSKAKDPAEYVAALKADCDKAALENEKLATVLNGEADGMQETLPEFQEGTESDAEVLSNRLANAINAKRDLQAREDSAVEAERLAKLAEAVIAAGQGQTVDEAQAALTSAKTEVEESEGYIREAEAALERERVRLDGLKRRVKDAESALESAEQRRDELTGARAALEAEATHPSAGDWEDAERAIKAAEDAVTTGAKIREAVETRDKIQAKRQEAADATKEAESLRVAAKKTVGLLVEPINALHCGIEIDDEMRLIFTEHPVRENGRCPVEELSPGEAWTLVLKLITRIVGGEDVETFVSIPQEALEGLDPINLKMLVDEVAKTRLMVFVAKATATEGPDGELSRDGVSSKIVETWKDLFGTLYPKA